jgi:hypothetical protein
MDWSARVLDAQKLNRVGVSFSSLVDALIEQQAGTWPQLREGLLALDAVELRRLDIDGVSVSLQHNPQRIVSTSASVDEQSIRERPCFLCPVNMPAQEKGLAFGSDLIVFCNPFPVLASHLVVLAREHIPQRVDGHLGHFLDLAAALGRDYVALYNGARCGASAPDHLHFQAGRIDKLSIFDEIARAGTRDDRGPQASSAYGTGFIWFRTNSRERALIGVERILGLLPRESNAEPMINLLARHDGLTWVVIVIPREKHRPAAYFREGDARILVSPAAIDLAGIVVVPRKSDFERLDSSEVRGIFAEVTFDLAALAAITTAVRMREQLEVQS